MVGIDPAWVNPQMPLEMILISIIIITINIFIWVIMPPCHYAQSCAQIVRAQAPL